MSYNELIGEPGEIYSEIRSQTISVSRPINEQNFNPDNVLIDYEQLMSKIVSREQWLDFYKSYGKTFFLNHFLRIFYS